MLQSNYVSCIKGTSVLGGGRRGVAIAGADHTITYAAAVALVRHTTLRQAAVTTQLLLQVLSQHLDKRELRRLIRLVYITTVHIHQPNIRL